MLEYAEKLTLTPAMMTEDDVNALRGVGWDDRDILELHALVASRDRL